MYPGLMFTSGFIHWLVHLLSVPIDIREICVFLAPLFSTFTAFATYLFTTEVWDESAGLFAAAFIGVVPGYISRSVAGSYDNEGIAIFALMARCGVRIRNALTCCRLRTSCGCAPSAWAR